MKNIVRILSFSLLVILFLPFLQTCSDRHLAKHSAEIPMSDSIAPTNSGFVIPPNQVNASHTIQNQVDTAFQKDKKSSTLSGYELFTTITFDGITHIKEIKTLNDAFALIVYFFFIVPIRLLPFILYYNWVQDFTYLFRINIAVLISSFIPIIWFTSLSYIDDIHQIRIGYYLFIGITTTLVYLSWKLHKKEKPTT